MKEIDSIEECTESIKVILHIFEGRLYKQLKLDIYALFNIMEAYWNTLTWKEADVRWHQRYQ